uniref:Uncharacterized protein n=1 Tax=Romanomermis culicivorax TaxID=13658 RepID=A0A915K0G2_ROMCU
MDESTPVQPTAIDVETNTATMNQTLTDILEETTTYQYTAIDVTPEKPAAVAPLLAHALDPNIYLATPAFLLRPLIIPTVAATWYRAPVHFLQQIISDLQWQALAPALTVYHFPSPPRGMLFPEHHWVDYPDVLKEEIQRIFLPPPGLP